MAHVGIVTRARMTSTRLPAEVLRGAGGRTLIEDRGAAEPGYSGIIDVLAANPDLAGMNQGVTQKQLGE